MSLKAILAHCRRLLASLRGQDPDPSPLEEMQELLELYVKAGRRCAYDFGHAVDYLPAGEERDVLRERKNMWLTLFNPGRDVKSYRSELHNEINSLARKVEELARRCEEHNVPIADIHISTPF